MFSLSQRTVFTRVAAARSVRFNRYNGRSAESPLRTFRTSSAWNRSAVHDSDPEVLETEKRRNLENKQHLTSTTHQDKAPGWNEYLATSSEAHVKADKYGEDGPPTIELAERTVQHVHQRHHGQSTKNSREEALYERDEVLGPLKTSSAGTVDGDVHLDQSHMTINEKLVKADRGEI